MACSTRAAPSTFNLYYPPALLKDAWYRSTSTSSCHERREEPCESRCRRNCQGAKEAQKCQMPKMRNEERRKEQRENERANFASSAMNGMEGANESRIKNTEDGRSQSIRFDPESPLRFAPVAPRSPCWLPAAWSSAAAAGPPPAAGAAAAAAAAAGLGWC